MTSKAKSSNATNPRTRTVLAPNAERQSIRPKQAASLLGVGLATLYRWQASRPDMPRARKLGPRTTVYDRAELLAWLDMSPDAGTHARGERV